MTSSTTTLPDSQQILDLFGRYAWGYDTSDFDLLGSVFHANASTSGKIINSEQSWGPWKGRDSIVSHLGTLRGGQPDQRRHQIHTPIFISLTADTAVVKAYLSLFAITSPQPPRLVATGTYTGSISKQNGVWGFDLLEAQLDSEF